jgi:hypothetical protein
MAEHEWFDIELGDSLVELLIEMGMAERVTVVRATPAFDAAVKRFSDGLGMQLVKPNGRTVRF